jgi:hypothetical protein
LHQGYSNGVRLLGVIKGYQQLCVRIGKDECAWLHGGVFFFLEYDIDE